MWWVKQEARPFDEDYGSLGLVLVYSVNTKWHLVNVIELGCVNTILVLVLVFLTK